MNTGTNGGSYIAVGDIHGCPRQLAEILALGEGFPNHQWVFLGDYIDRGPDSETVLRILSRLDAVFLLGNHEDMLLSRWRGASTPASRAGWLDEARVSATSMEWIASVSREFYETADYFFVHGGLDVDKPLSAQTRADYLWTRTAGDYQALTPKLVVHGHHPVPRPVVVGNRVNLNTGCGQGGPLTALVLPEFLFLESGHSPVPTLKPRTTPEVLAALVDEGLEEL